eukprot:Opistho-2@11647
MDSSRSPRTAAMQMHTISSDAIGSTDVWVEDETSSVQSMGIAGHPDPTRTDRSISRVSSRRGSLQSSSAARGGMMVGAGGVGATASVAGMQSRIERAPSSRSTESKESTSRAPKPTDLLYLLQGYEPVRGPIQTQMALVYLLFIAFSGSAEGLRWAPNLRLYLIFVYIVAALLIWEVTRMIFFVRPLSVAPMYITLVPMAIMLALSREAHIVVGVLWYASILIIYLQSGATKLRNHVAFFTAAYIGVYFAVIGFMDFFYTCEFPCIEKFKGDKLDPPIEWREEATFVLCLVLMAFSYKMLHRFIELYAKTLVDREAEANTLLQTNVELRKELKKLKSPNVTYDLESPLAKVLDILVATRQNQSTDVAETLDFVISVLQSNVHKLFSPDLYDNPVDEDLHTWLDTLLLSDSTARTTGAAIAVASTSTSANSGSGQIVSHVPSVAVSLKRVYSYDRSNGSITVGSGSGSGDGTSAHGIVSNVHLNMPARVHTTEPQILEYLNTFTEWEFDVFELAQRTNGRPLYYLSKAIFERHFFRQKFLIDDEVLSEWLQKIEQGYLSHNPYHNSTHAADVTQTMHFFLTHDSLYHVLSDEEFFAAVVSCIIHDFEHPGTNNAFHINTGSELAVRYNDRSVLENHHCAAAFTLLSNDSCNILANLDEPTFKLIREMVVNLVLATDMAHHFEYVGKFKNKLQTGLNPEDRDDRRLMLEVGIKCADVSNPAKPRHVCTRWADQIMEEFYRQGDEERRRDMTVSMFMDRHTTNMPKCQAGFVDFIVGPMYESWLSFLSGDEEVKVGGYIKSNMEYWKGLVDEAEAMLVAKKMSSSEPPAVAVAR